MRSACTHEALRKTWDPFIYTHHYDIHDDFYDSWPANHPRRSGDATRNQYWEAKFVSSNRVPNDFETVDDLTTV